MMKRRLGLLVLFAAGLAIGGFLVAWLGLYNIAASRSHWPITEWFLEFAMRNSIETQSMNVTTPRLDDPALIRRGAGHFQGGCVPCHGAPGESQSPIARQMLPEPPYLADVDQWSEPWTASELFWIVKHGLKYTGMPAWPALEREDEVWAVVAFLQRLPELSPETYRLWARGEAALAVRSAEENAELLALSGPVGDSLTACARCHGFDGAGAGIGAFPRLSDLSAEYLYEALKTYAIGARPSGIMQPVAAELSESEMRALAAYYAGIDDAPYPPVAALEDADAELLDLGETLVTEGLPKAGIPACSACHGPQAGADDPLYPSLAGQYPEYIAQQLHLWKRGARGDTPYSEIMATIARNMTEEQIRASALYYGALRPDAPLARILPRDE